MAASVAAAAPLPEPAASTGAAAAAAQRQAKAGSAEIETCGGAWVVLDGNGETDGVSQRLDELKRRARERTLAALSAAPDELAQAAVLLLGAATTGSQSTGAAAAVPEQADNALARLAQSSRDPRVYALAFRACGASCPMLSAAQWARLDPGNAVPWLYVAQAALARHDPAAVDEAMYRVSLAQRSETGAELTARVLEQVPVDDATLPGSAAFLVEVSAAQAALTTPVTVAVDYCAAAALLDANHWQVCSHVAEVLATRSARVAERRAGTAIGAALGWPVERLTELHGEQQAALDAAGAALQSGSDLLGCAGARRRLGWLRAAAANGEVSAAQPRR